MNASEITLVCPRCGQIDAVRKVSAIHREGISVSQYETYATGQLGDKVISWPVKKEQVSVGLLAQKLSPPSKPRYETFYYSSESGTVFDIRTRFIFLILLGLSALVGVWVSSKTGSEVLGWMGGILTFGGILFLKVSYDLRRFEEVKQALPLWQRAIKRWDSLYYCFRCDGGFIPGQNRFVPIASIQSFLYEQDA